MSKELYKKIYNLYYVDNLKLKSVRDRLLLSGIDISMSRLKLIIDIMSELLHSDSINESVLESFEKIKVEFDSLLARVKSVMDTAKENGDSQSELRGITELRLLLEMGLKRLGELGNRLVRNETHIHGDMNIVENYNLYLKELFKMGAEEQDGKIVITTPSPEFLLDFRKNKNEIKKLVPLGEQ